MVAQCIAPIQGSLFRMMRLDSCGAPVLGTGSLIVSAGFVQVQASPQYEDPTQYRKRRADGVNCVNRRGPEQFERDELTIEFCSIDPDGVVISTGQQLITSGTTGTGFWIKEGPVTARWSLEVWQADSETCTGASPRFAYWAWPNLSSARLTDMTIEDNALAWSVVANSEKANPSWNVPGASKPIPMPPPSGAHRGFNINTVPVPAETGCGSATLAIP
jgi:hypothetical protein